jgi:hypothetical protein
MASWGKLFPTQNLLETTEGLGMISRRMRVTLKTFVRRVEQKFES